MALYCGKEKEATMDGTKTITKENVIVLVSLSYYYGGGGAGGEAGEDENNKIKSLPQTVELCQLIFSPFKAHSRP